MGALIKNILIIGGLIAVAGVGYYLIVAERGSAIDSENALVAGQAERETQEFLRRLSDLRSVTLSPDIFSDPRFVSFVDFSSPVEQLPYGRENPFSGQ